MRRAFSLLEVLVAAGLSLLVVGLLAELLLPSLWLYQKEQAVSEVHQSALLVRQKLERELVNTCLETITVYHQDPDWYLAWAEVANFDKVTRGPVYNLKGEFSLARYQASRSCFSIGLGTHPQVPPATFSATSSQAPRLTTQQLMDIFQGQNGARITYPLHELARNVEKFSFTDMNGDDDFSVFFPPLTFSLTTKAAVNDTRVERAELECKLTPKMRRW